MTRFFAAFYVVITMASSTNAAPPKVLADIAPVHSLVAQVMGDLGKPDLLLDPSSDVHHLQLRPSQARAMADAELVFWIGAELEPWLQSSLDSLNAAAVSVALGGGEHHPWLDPELAIEWLDVIANSLAELDAENAKVYLANAGIARVGLMDLLQETTAILRSVSSKGFVVDHDAYGAFSKRFGIRILAALRDGEAVEPGAAHVTEIRGLLNNGQVDCIFAGAGHADALVQTVARGTSVQVGELDAMGINLEPGRAQYADLIRQTARAFANCG